MGKLAEQGDPICADATTYSTPLLSLATNVIMDKQTWCGKSNEIGIKVCSNRERACEIEVACDNVGSAEV